MEYGLRRFEMDNKSELVEVCNDIDMMQAKLKELRAQRDRLRKIEKLVSQIMEEGEEFYDDFIEYLNFRIRRDGFIRVEA